MGCVCEKIFYFRSSRSTAHYQSMSLIHGQKAMHVFDHTVLYGFVNSETKGLAQKVSSQTEKWWDAA